MIVNTTTISITTSVEEEFSIPLQATPSTGYVWEIDGLTEDLKLLERYNQKVMNDVPGHPLTQVFRFLALKKGDFNIHFLLKREWEQQPIETVLAIIHVH